MQEQIEDGQLELVGQEFIHQSPYLFIAAKESVTKFVFHIPIYKKQGGGIIYSVMIIPATTIRIAGIIAKNRPPKRPARAGGGTRTHTPEGTRS